MEDVRIGDRAVGKDRPPYVIAEIGANHNGDPALLEELIAAAARSGADAAKFQSWTESSLISRAEYERNTTYSDTKRHFGSLKEMVRAYRLTPELEEQARASCREKGLQFLSSAFSVAEVTHLEGFDVPAHKVASMDIEHPLLLDAVADTGKPVLLSTGMSTLSEIARAVEHLDARGSGPVIPLHCVSLYPVPAEALHLRNIPTLREALGRHIGFSDHALGVESALTAAALGAVVIEKHFTVDKELEGWDHWISADEDELRRIVDGTRRVVAALGSSTRSVSEGELEKRRSFRRRIVLKGPLPAGHRIEESDLDFKRPGTGIAPWDHDKVVGRELAVDVEEDHELDWSELR